VTSTGGSSATGGSTRTGGATSTGGSSATGGSTRTGGATGTGGSSATGGSTRTGGATSTGGTTTTGGATSTGGAIGPVTTTCPGAVPAGITSSFCSCNTFASTPEGGYTVYNNVWGSGAGPECVWTATGTKWGVTANHPNTGGVKSYPNISVSPKTVVSAINTYTSSFDITVPTGGSWEAAYDIWVRPAAGGTRIEIMLWMYKTGGVGPISTGAGTPATVGGHSWNVYYGSNGGNDVVSFLRTSNTTSGTVDVKAILDWIIANDKTQYGAFTSSATLDQVQWGFEISGDGSAQAFVNNSFSVTSS
jgi:hypothetical protein